MVVLRLPAPELVYIKIAGSLVSLRGLSYVGGFLTVVIGPVLPVAIYGVIATQERDVSLSTDLRRSAPLVVGSGLFLTVWLFIVPIQGFLWRFQVPILPAFLLLVLFHARDTDVLRLRRSISTQNILTAVVIVSLVGFPLHTIDSARAETGARDQTDRVRMGQSLESLADEDYRMVVSESGAVPYYSECEAVDVPGLNSERIAHRGLSRQYLRAFSPDLVMLLVGAEPGFLREKSPLVARFLEQQDCRIVTVVKKTEDGERYHVYFVDPESAGAREISCTLLETPDIEHVSRDGFVDLATVDISASETTRRSCRSSSG